MSEEIHPMRTPLSPEAERNAFLPVDDDLDDDLDYENSIGYNLIKNADQGASPDGAGATLNTGSTHLALLLLTLMSVALNVA